MFVCYRVARYKNFVVNRKASIFVSYVIKEFAHSFSCAYIELWIHLGSLESTQEVIYALDICKIFKFMLSPRTCSAERVGVNAQRVAHNMQLFSALDLGTMLVISVLPSRSCYQNLHLRRQ